MDRVILLVICAIALAMVGKLCKGDEPVRMMELSPATRAWFTNPDGSCVQCSIGMVGVHCNDRNAASLLWDSEFGRAVRGADPTPRALKRTCDNVAWSAGPSRVARLTTRCPGLNGPRARADSRPSRPGQNIFKRCTDSIRTRGPISCATTTAPGRSTSIRSPRSGNCITTACPGA